ncbi:AcrR family transcriptional regulator [Catenulispora sp. GAS73]|uniref:TetR/AcrR family transcriptional regulator C-terminal domain-containing protein n=1 Tax=Catenulispora sp. GAS73 TaxID=3156269 RepID=UPI003513B7A1
MPTERTSAGDPAHTLRVLWRTGEDPAATAAPRRGPRRALSVEAVVATATALADAEGLEAVTIRRVAQELGVVPMSLYTYVPGKAELLDLMMDTAYAAMPRPQTAGRPWRERVRAIAEENRELFERHPWAAEVSTARPPLGPGLMAKYEHELTAFQDMGLSDVQTDDCLTHLLGFVQGWARSAADTRAAQVDSAMSDRQWWQANAPLLEKVFDAEKYPTAVRVGSAAGEAHGAAYDPDHAYEFGLERVLDSFQALVA